MTPARLARWDGLYPPMPQNYFARAGRHHADRAHFAFGQHARACSIHCAVQTVARARLHSAGRRELFAKPLLKFAGAVALRRTAGDDICATLAFASAVTISAIWRSGVAQRNWARLVLSPQTLTCLVNVLSRRGHSSPTGLLHCATARWRVAASPARTGSLYLDPSFLTGKTPR